VREKSELKRRGANFEMKHLLATCERIGVREFGGFGQGVVALRDVKAGDTLLKVPLEKWYPMSAGNAYDTYNLSRPDFCERLIQYSKKLDTPVIGKPLFVGSVLMMVQLLDLVDNSVGDVRDHVDSIPRNIDVPIFWPSLDSVRGLPIERAILEQRQLILSTYSNVVEPEFEHISAPKFAWAWTVLLSRAISNSKEQMPFSIAPVLDFFNHESNRSAPGFCHHWFDHQKKEFVVSALNDVEADSQLFISYGALNNADLLRLYGFCLEDNRDDYVAIQMDTRSSIRCTQQGVEFNGMRDPDMTDSHILFQLEKTLAFYSTNWNHEENYVHKLISGETDILKNCISKYKR